MPFYRWSALLFSWVSCLSRREAKSSSDFGLRSDSTVLCDFDGLPCPRVDVLFGLPVCVDYVVFRGRQVLKSVCPRFVALRGVQRVWFEY